MAKRTAAPKRQTAVVQTCAVAVARRGATSAQAVREDRVGPSSAGPVVLQAGPLDQHFIDFSTHELLLSAVPF
jgi:hypothetical protein